MGAGGGQLERGRGSGSRDDHYLWFFPAGRDYTVTALNMSRDGKPRVKPSFEKNIFFWTNPEFVRMHVQTFKEGLNSKFLSHVQTTTATPTVVD